MPCFDSGVYGYVKASALVTVSFPVDKRGNAAIACIYCPYLSANQKICQLNKSIVAFPEKYVGDNCPLERMEDNEQSAANRQGDKRD